MRGSPRSTPDNYMTALYTELQQALRAAVSASEVETLLQNRAELGPQILQTCQPAAERLASYSSD